MVSGVMREQDRERKRRERESERERVEGDREAGVSNGQKREELHTNKKSNIYHVIKDSISNLKCQIANITLHICKSVTYKIYMI